MKKRLQPSRKTTKRCGRRHARRLNLDFPRQRRPATPCSRAPNNTREERSRRIPEMPKVILFSLGHLAELRSSKVPEGGRNTALRFDPALWSVCASSPLTVGVFTSWEYGTPRSCGSTPASASSRGTFLGEGLLEVPAGKRRCATWRRLWLRIRSASCTDSTWGRYAATSGTRR